MKQNQRQRQIDLVLVGGGHSHVQVLESFAMEPPPDTRITLIVDRPIAMYSGMVPGFVAGQYNQEDLAIDVVPLARRVGARVILARASRIDPEQRSIHLEDRPPIRFDYASINVGSTVAGLETPGVREHAIPTRPIGDFVARLDAVFRELNGEDVSKRVVVVGGGVGGVEVAFALDHRIRRLGASAEVTLAESGPKILPSYSDGMRRRAERTANQRGIRIVTGRRITRVEDARVFFEHDESGLPFDLLLWVTGAAGISLFRDSGIATDDRGFARVRSTLQLEEYDHVLAAGDCATLSEHPQTPKAGVYAVRQGPVLAANLRRLLAGERRLERYRPQHDFLTLINTGDGSAIGGKWSVSFEGRWVFRLKDHIDRKFMHRFQPLEDTGRPTAFDTEGMGSPSDREDSEMEAYCGGCAAKLGRHALERALSRLSLPPQPKFVDLGLARPDDAASYASPLGQRIVASVDQFRAFTDDPYLVGRVGAINAASDLYAKGVDPKVAQALVALPEAASDAEREETLFQLMAGAARSFEELDVTLVGGHTTTSGELLAGFHVEGFLQDGDDLLAQAQLAEDHALILTKALGTGVLFRADMMGHARGTWFQSALASMLRANREAAELARRHGARAATDVTGFGLAGHLDAMLEAAELGARLDVTALPALPGSLELLGSGLRSTFHDENMTTLGSMAVDLDAQRHPKFELLFDPQTSGGLLFGLARESATRVLEELRSSGHCAAIIGVTRSLAGSGERIRVSTSLD